MSELEDLFGSKVFSDAVMRERLPENVYEALQKTISEGSALERSVANTVAFAMKEWAIEKGATHYSHWFQPMTGVTAEKHEAFLTPDGHGGAIADFSGGELIKGEPDASSFPSGGLRVTFEARGYTAWDPTSFAFIKDNTLCIPTVFCSYTGEVLDKKTPLLRSNEAINSQTLRVLGALGYDGIRHVSPSVGAEQEYFLIDKSIYDARPDLKYTGRTLFGARSPRGQELSDQYSGALKTRVSTYMRDLDSELWKLGIYARTEHNEAAPSQHELAPLYTNVNTACDHNQLMMELMKKVAEKHGFVCLLHEKPYAGVNGSGKHNNWSLSTDTGENLFNPGDDTPSNLRFLLFVAAVIRAVDLHSDLLSISAATAGNDERLGGNEAPPSIISIHLGEELTDMLEAVANEKSYAKNADDFMETGVRALPQVRRDASDRNRTSPLAFTGNKFEFRMPGSSSSVADPDIMMNTIVADTLKYFADRLENSSDKRECARGLIRETMEEHSRIIFDGNNYSPSWHIEAKKRGLKVFESAADAVSHLTDPKNVSLFGEHGIYTLSELTSRQEIMLENYSKTIQIEALTALDMAKKDILPAIERYSDELAKAAADKRALNISCAYETKTCAALSDIMSEMHDEVERLDVLIDSVPRDDTALRCALFFRNNILPAMNGIRALADRAELNTARDHWPYPSMGEMLFSEE